MYRDMRDKLSRERASRSELRAMRLCAMGHRPVRLPVLVWRHTCRSGVSFVMPELSITSRFAWDADRSRIFLAPGEIQQIGAKRAVAASA